MGGALGVLERKGRIACVRRSCTVVWARTMADVKAALVVSSADWMKVDITGERLCGCTCTATWSSAQTVFCQKRAMVEMLSSKLGEHVGFCQEVSSREDLCAG